MNYKIKDMQRIFKIVIPVSLLLVLAACGAGSKDDKKVADVKKEIEKKKKEKTDLDAEIKKLEEQLTALDPEAANTAKLVSVADVAQKDFMHYIELQGKIDADNIAYVAPKGMGGLVKAVYVKLGDRVSKGQAILKLDDVLLSQGVTSARQSLDIVKARLDQAKTIYERRQNLWKQNIGSEIEVINAKAEVDALQSQYNAGETGLKIAQEQLSQSIVRAEISGVIDELNIKPGELFGQATAGMGIRIVNTSSLKMVTPVPENYITRVKKGDKVLVIVPETGKAPYETTLSTVGASIANNTRSFITEAKLPSDPLLKPNQTASMKILDYQSKNAIVIPVNVVQTDEKGKYVFVTTKSGNKNIAKKKQVTVGQVYDGQIEVLSGLAAGEQIITDGYQSVYDGQAITTGI